MSMIDRAGGNSFSLRPARCRSAAALARAERCVALLSLAIDRGAGANELVGLDDPSLSHATDARVPNLLGRPGAIAADLMMQLFGVGITGVPIADRGVGLSVARPSAASATSGCSLLLWLFGAVLAAAFASSLPRGVRWPLQCGLGGVVGDAILRLPAALFGTRLTAHRISLIAASALGVAADLPLSAAPREFSARRAERRGKSWLRLRLTTTTRPTDRAWIFYGSLMHTVLSFRSRLTRMFPRAARPSAQAAGSGRGDASAQRRVEPRLDGPRHSRIGGENNDESEDEDGDEPAPRAARKPRATIKPTRRSNGGYVLPQLDLLSQPSKLGRATVSSDTLRENSTALEGVLEDFGVKGEIIHVRPGPVVTLYELEPAPGIKSSRVIGLADDIARSMSALSARVAVV